MYRILSGDLVTGPSTGAVLSLARLYPGPDGRPRSSAGNLVDGRQGPRR